MQIGAFPYITTVIQAAASKDLTVLATVKSRLKIDGTDDDAVINELIHEASSLMEDACGQGFASERLASEFETERRSTGRLWLPRTPVTQVHEVVENGATLQPAQYRVQPDSGETWRLDSSGRRICWPSCGVIKVEFTAGYVLLTTLPHHFEAACIVQVAAMYWARTRDPALRGFEIPDDYSAQFSVPGGDSFGANGLLTGVWNAISKRQRFGATS